MTNKTPNGARKHRESTQPNNSKTAKLFFFFLQMGQLNTASTSRAGLRTKQQHFLQSSARPHRFFTTSKSRKAHVATHLNTTASYLGRHFLYLYLACALKRHLATNCYSRLLNQKLSRCAFNNLPCTCLYLYLGMGRSIEEAEYALCCQSNQALEKTEVGPYH